MYSMEVISYAIKMHEAHVYFLQFSVVMILDHLFHPGIRDKTVLVIIFILPLLLIIRKFDFFRCE